MSARGQIITDIRTLVVEECINCGVVFALDSGWQEERRKDHRNWFCPNGHQQHYSGETEAERQRRRADEAERLAASRAEDLRIEKAAHRATKTTLTKTKNRAARGVCLCCHRSFVNVARHMAGQHPDFVPTPTP